MSSIRESLGIGVLHSAVKVPYTVGTEPSSREPRSNAGGRCAASAVDARLADYFDDVEAGVPDPRIAEAAGATPRQVREWRRRNAMHRRAGRPSNALRLATFATDVFGRGAPVRVAVRGAGLEFEPPEYVLRYPLDYPSFCEAMTRLLASGMSKNRIASALGVRERDVEAAAILERRRAE